MLLALKIFAGLVLLIMILGIVSTICRVIDWVCKTISNGIELFHDLQADKLERLELLNEEVGEARDHRVAIKKIELKITVLKTRWFRWFLPSYDVN